MIMNECPFSNKNFIAYLEETNCVGENSGWTSHHFNSENAMLPSYIKSHSYGEYIFDWAWADFYHKNGLNYFPKLTHAIPFTPVNASKFIGNKTEFQALAQDSFNFYQNHNLSSEHYLFINKEEENLLKSFDFKIQYTHQYHFENEYESFEHFLDSLKKNKRKNIKKERRSIQEGPLEIQIIENENINVSDLESLYQSYISTIRKKNSYAYLSKSFFLGLKQLPVLIIKAELNGKTIASSLFFKSTNTLYGRYWGILPEYEQSFPYLHFELCYYRAMEYCINNNFKTLEAGAQGEHKLVRGFSPVVIKSAHHIKIPQVFDIIKQHIDEINNQTINNINAMKNYLPFKHK